LETAIGAAAAVWQPIHNTIIQWFIVLQCAWMVAHLAAVQRIQFRNCGKFSAASARSTKTELTDWANFVEKLLLI
jgi:hypothetical protein